MDAVWEMVIEVSEATTEMFKRAGSFETFCKDEESGAASYSEMLVTTHQSTRRHKPEGRGITFHYRREQRIIWKLGYDLRYKSNWVKFQILKYSPDL